MCSEVVYVHPDRDRAGTKLVWESHVSRLVQDAASPPGWCLTTEEFPASGEDFALLAACAVPVWSGPMVTIPTCQPFGLAAAPCFLSGEHPLTPHLFPLPGDKPSICTILGAISIAHRQMPVGWSRHEYTKVGCPSVLCQCSKKAYQHSQICKREGYFLAGHVIGEKTSSALLLGFTIQHLGAELLLL